MTKVWTKIVICTRSLAQVLLLLLVVQLQWRNLSITLATEHTLLKSSEGGSYGREAAPDSLLLFQPAAGRQRKLQTWLSWGGNTFNVIFYGAKGDGKTVDTQAFEKAWQEACIVAGSVVLVPQGREFLVGPITFLGPCKPNIAFQVDGKILAVGSSASEWRLVKNNYWLHFKGLSGLAIRGEGTIDGNGATWWSKGCKKAKYGTSCKSPTALKIFRSSNVVVSGIKIYNAPQDHLRFTTCSQVLVTGVSVESPKASINTDGFYFDNTHKATLEYSTAATGDDCVGIQSGSSDILIQHFKCGPGHGISIGSLGQHGILGCVSNVRVRDVTVENAKGAVRIKTWQGGSGSVTRVSFERITVKNVENPIVINQYYCDSSRHNCKNSTKALAISHISFQNIKGTYLSLSGEAVKIACSDIVPCTGISMINVNLWPASGAQIRKSENFKGGSSCWNAFGSVDGYSSTVGIRDCVQPQPSNRFWGSTLAKCEHQCAQS